MESDYGGKEEGERARIAMKWGVPTHSRYNTSFKSPGREETISCVHCSA